MEEDAQGDVEEEEESWINIVYIPNGVWDVVDGGRVLFALTLTCH